EIEDCWRPAWTGGLGSLDDVETQPISQREIIDRLTGSVLDLHEDAEQSVAVACQVNGMGKRLAKFIDGPRRHAHASVVNPADGVPLGITHAGGKSSKGRRSDEQHADRL